MDAQDKADKCVKRLLAVHAAFEEVRKWCDGVTRVFAIRRRAFRWLVPCRLDPIALTSHVHFM